MFRINKMGDVWFAMQLCDELDAKDAIEDDLENIAIFVEEGPVILCQELEDAASLLEIEVTEFVMVS